MSSYESNTRGSVQIEVRLKFQKNMTLANHLFSIDIILEIVILEMANNFIFINVKNTLFQPLTQAKSTYVHGEHIFITIF